VQPTGRLHPDHRWTSHPAGPDQPGQGVDALAQHRRRHRLPDRPTLPLVSQTRLLTLPGLTATTSADTGTAWRNSPTPATSSPTARDLPAGKFLTLKVAQELSAAGLRTVAAAGFPAVTNRRVREAPGS
jgi:hypothetical protein